MTASSPDNSQMIFQPWLASLCSSSMEYKPEPTWWSPTTICPSSYNTTTTSYSHQNYSALPPFNHGFHASTMSGVDGSIPERPSSVLSSVSTVSVSSASTTSSAPYTATDGDSESTESDNTQFGATSRSKKRSKGANYKRYPKPPYSYCALIVTAIQNSPNQRLTLSGVIHRLTELFEFFRGSYTGWRDCIRHNLSHNACFYKVPYPLPGEDEITGRKSKGRSFWKVDLAKVPTHIFKILDKKAEKAGTFKTYIHDELGLPEVVLTGSATAIKEEPDWDTHAQTSYSAADQTGNRARYNMRLPHVNVTSCCVSRDSPEQPRRHDSLDAYTVCTPSSTITDLDDVKPIVKRRRLAETYEDNFGTTAPAHMEHIWDMVKAMTRLETSSTDAVNNLSDLC